LQKEISVAIDAMGGDYAPSEVVKGAVSASKLYPDVKITLVGRKEAVESELAGFEGGFPAIRVEAASEVVDMDDRASWSVKSKRNSSIAVGARLVKEKAADAFISAGNTGAVASASLLIMGRIRGVSRPAIGIMVPALNRPVLLLDAGATADCKPENLVQFAQMAHIYMERVLDVKNPSIGLLSIGEEKGKGNELVQQASQLLQQTHLNFAGNVEGKDIPIGKTDIVVCDGFTGNVVLKVMEGVVNLIFSQLKELTVESVQAKLGGLLLKPKLMELKKRLDHEEYGGTQLLGVDGVCIICHGSSKAKAIRNAVGIAAKTVRQQVVEKIKQEIAREE